MDQITPFPEVFAAWNSHMVLIPVDENTYILDPPNQLDWSYTLTKISDKKWRVKGSKQEHYDAAETCDDVYEYADGKWCIMSEKRV